MRLGDIMISNNLLKKGKKGKRKGQVAVEYMMNYGWAMLIILAVIGLLLASGIWKRPTPTECFVHPDLPCVAAAIQNDPYSSIVLTFVIRNNQGGEISDLSIDSVEIIEGPSLTLDHMECDPEGLSQGETSRCDAKYIATGINNIGEPMKFRFTLRYKDEMGVEHVTSGHVSGTVVRA